MIVKNWSNIHKLEPFVSRNCLHRVKNKQYSYVIQDLHILNESLYYELFQCSNKNISYAQRLVVEFKTRRDCEHTRKIFPEAEKLFLAQKNCKGTHSPIPLFIYQYIYPDKQTASLSVKVFCFIHTKVAKYHKSYEFSDPPGPMQHCKNAFVQH